MTAVSASSKVLLCGPQMCYRKAPWSGGEVLPYRPVFLAIFGWLLQEVSLTREFADIPLKCH